MRVRYVVPVSPPRGAGESTLCSWYVHRVSTVIEFWRVWNFMCLPCRPWDRSVSPGTWATGVEGLMIGTRIIAERRFRVGKSLGVFGRSLFQIA